ncbi:putative membrane protein [Erwinia persicina]|jgi:uncharacterized membrane protein|uniref:DUF2231 domain-containing protein n=1 Tax=Erwinia plantamica TaxID=3237104 RepID=A0ABW7CI11_9GAMM|nr:MULTISPECIES: DUF2231 domain-containing protein [Erwinia]MCP1436955.1 putative membrane protein [Erwinia persicina]MDN4625916.1 hypothetical protein [Erwinia sp. PsM31]MDN8540320.1 hypothetical protein [Erwinia sp. BC051422]
MTSQVTSRHSTFAVAVYSLFHPVPLGFFVAGWIFDIIYLYSTEIFWTQAASWLIAIGLIIAIIPRLINLVQVWVGVSYPQGSAIKVHFWAYLLAIILEIFNAFIHSRDAWAVVPAGVILSTLAVVLMLFANVQLAVRDRTA